MKKNLPLFPLYILLVLAFLTRFLFLYYPAQVVFDEVHFGKFVSAYFTHQYYFDIHPPLGKLMIASFASLFGFQGDFDFNLIGENYNPYYLFILRFLPAFFSALFVVLIYWFSLILGFSKKAAFLAGFFVLFDNAILGQSKFILVDIFLLFFGFASLLFFFLARKMENKKNLIYYLISAVFAGLSFSVKWTGLSFLGLILAFLFLDFLNEIKIKKYLLKLSIFILIPFLAYVLIFAIHFSQLKQSGPGSAFMSPAFNNQSLSFVGKFLELNKAMYTYNKSITASHPDASRWFEWPFTKKPIWFWNKSSEQSKSDIYLVGNPAVWWLALFSVISSLILIFFKKFRKKLSFLVYFLLFGYFLNLLPFVFVSRATFLYHYFSSLVFGIIIFALLCDKFIFCQEKIEEKPYKMKKLEAENKLKIKKEFLTFGSSKQFFAFSFLLLIVLSAFLIFSPLTYGFPVPPETQKLLNLFLK